MQENHRFPDMIATIRQLILLIAILGAGLIGAPFSASAADLCKDSVASRAAASAPRSQLPRGLSGRLRIGNVRAAGKYLDVKNRSKKHGAYIVSWRKERNQKNQIWSLLKVGSYYKIRNERSGLFLSVKTTSGRWCDRHWVIQAGAPRRGDAASQNLQLWGIYCSPSPVTVTCSIKNLSTRTQLDIKNKSKGNGAYIVVFPYRKDRRGRQEQNQRWSLLSVR